jgi:hypothetical protein
MPKPVRGLKSLKKPKALKGEVDPPEEKTPYRRWQAWRHLEQARQQAKQEAKD